MQPSIEWLTQNKMIRFNPENIIISRADSIGDVVLTLPVAKLLKDHFPSAHIIFLGKEYTRPVIEACSNIDEFLELETFLSATTKMADSIVHVFPLRSIAKKAKQLKIETRVGTTNRIYHWLTCNKLVPLSRKKSDLHEAQLNIKLLQPFGVERSYSLRELGDAFGLSRLKPLRAEHLQLFDSSKFNIILHPKSQGNGREWGLDSFISLIHLLDKSRFKIFISGTAKEQPLLKPVFDAVGADVIDLTGKMELSEFISFISKADGLVASGTGPLHLAAALGRNAYGLFPPIRPIHPGRWAPLGKGAQVFVADRACDACASDAAKCSCMKGILPTEVLAAIEKNYREKFS